jgi:hypothetical protein
MGPLKHVLRRPAQAPGFSAIAVITLALGIGANTAIFSVVEGVLIKPLAFPKAQELVAVWHLAPGVQGIIGHIESCPTMYFTYREENHTFQDIGIWNSGGTSVTGLAEPEQVRTVNVTYGTLQALGVQPAIGRWFSQEDDTPGTPETVILSYGYWQRRFGANASAIGRAITLDSKPHTIIGVMRSDFRFLNFSPDLIMPMRFDRNKVFLGNFSYQGIARLKPGVTIEQANADVGRMLGIWLKGLARSAWIQPCPVRKRPVLAEASTAETGRGRRYWKYFMGSHGHHRASALDRLCERRKSTSCARRGPPAGACYPGCSGRGLGQDCARTAS